VPTGYRSTTAEALASWAYQFVPAAEDLALAERSLRDTSAVALAAAGHPVVRYGRQLGPAGALAVAAHVLDFDDLHMESTAHVSAVVVPVVVATGGDARSYLAGAGVMARLGTALGWPHYLRGWHATCTAGAPAAALAAAMALNLGEEEAAHAVALAVPAAGGVQRAFGTDAKSLQVGMAADAGVRAARLAGSGARADLRALDQWLEVVGASPAAGSAETPAVPGGLAIKLYPCCYALQRPIEAVRSAIGTEDPSAVEAVTVETPEAAVRPLVHHEPRTGLEGKFSLEYGVAAALLDRFPTLESFSDDHVRRPAAIRIMQSTTTRLSVGGDSLLDGTCEIVLRLRDGSTRRAVVAEPRGSPNCPPSRADLETKLAGCGPGARDAVSGLTWAEAPQVLAPIWSAG
jgi:2-methylcitrate dehydratase PrpD